MTLRVVIADDQPLMRSALRSCLSREPDIDVAAEAANGLQAVNLVTELKPDLALLDVRMPVLDGLEATRRIVHGIQPSQTRVIVMTSFDLDEYIFTALNAGASGFLLKDVTPEELVHAVRVVAGGDALLTPGVTRRVLERFAGLLPPPPSVGGPAFTPREEAVLRLVARGDTNAQIAAELHLAESSVKTHVGHLLAKLDAPDRVHLVIYAYESGRVLAAARPPRGERKAR